MVRSGALCGGGLEASPSTGALRPVSLAGEGVGASCRRAVPSLGLGGRALGSLISSAGCTDSPCHLSPGAWSPAFSFWQGCA